MVQRYFLPQQGESLQHLTGYDPDYCVALIADLAELGPPLPPLLVGRICSESLQEEESDPNLHKNEKFCLVQNSSVWNLHLYICTGGRVRYRRKGYFYYC